jgi:hypothetical protein
VSSPGERVRIAVSDTDFAEKPPADPGVDGILDEKLLELQADVVGALFRVDVLLPR